jgi:hypothetical protein
VKKLGGRLTKEAGKEVTHLITKVDEQGLCPRTIKYAFCVLYGAHIVSHRCTFSFPTPPPRCVAYYFTL